MSEIKTKIVARGKVANICLCGGYYVKGSLGMHKKTQNHKAYVDTPIGEVFTCYIDRQGRAVQVLNRTINGSHEIEIYEIIKV